VSIDSNGGDKPRHGLAGELNPGCASAALIFAGRNPKSGMNKPFPGWIHASALVLTANFIFSCLVVIGEEAFAGEGKGAAASYVVSLEGAPDNELKELLISVSDTFSLQNSPPPSFNLLDRRIERDLSALRQALRSHGFFQGEITADIDKKKDPARVIFTIQPGTPFLLSSVAIRPRVEMPEFRFQPPEASELGLALHKPFKAESVVRAQERLLLFLGRKGFPFPKVTARRVIADHATHSVRLDFHFDPGPRAMFGDTVITGLKSLRKEFLLKRLPWKTGDSYDISLVIAARAALIGTNLFSVVDINPGAFDPSTGRLPMAVSVSERDHRTFKAGVQYRTDEGAGMKLGWEHRNILGSGEKLDTALNLKEKSRTLEAGFYKPGFLSGKQSLLLKSSLSDERTDAYTSRSVEVSGTIDRQLTRQANFGAGLKYRHSWLERLDLKKTFGLLSLPAYLNVDTSDDMLDPSRGGRINIMLAPHTDLLGHDVGFVKSRIFLSGYLEILKKKQAVLALRASVGSIAGAGRDKVPADMLFYAGGSGSVRGYPYQTAGDMQNGSPLGGLSFLDMSGELRFKVTQDLGLAAFLDGGRAYALETPDLDRSLFFGAGFGLRYYTPIGPVRMDVAFPLDRREGIDDDFQIYLSIGQAF